MGRPSKLQRALEDLLGRRAPWEAEDEARELLYGICLASGVEEGTCDKIDYSYRWAIADYYAGVTGADREKALKGIEEVMGRFELKGRCLVEKGVSVEDPSVCEGDPGEGLVVVGSRMQLFVNRLARGAVVRAGGSCAAAVGAMNAWSLRALRKLRAGRRGLLDHDEYGAVFAVGRCSLGDLPRLAEEALDLHYRGVYEDCKIVWGDSEMSWEETEAALIAEDEELEDCLKLLRELEGGGRA